MVYLVPLITMKYNTLGIFSTWGLPEQAEKKASSESPQILALIAIIMSS